MSWIEEQKIPSRNFFEVLWAFRWRGHLVISSYELTGEMLIFQAINNRKSPNFSSWAIDVMENV